MSYATVRDLIARFDEEEIAQRADRGIPRLVTAGLLAAIANEAALDSWNVDERTAGDAAVSRLASVIADAESTINGYLASRYTVPLATPPEALRRVCCDLARYFLYNDQATDTIQKRYDAAIAYLKDVSTGKVSLGEIVEPPAPGGTVEIHSGGSVFARDKSRGFI